jgi:hypothetical protein
MQTFFALHIYVQMQLSEVKTVSLFCNITNVGKIVVNSFYQTMINVIYYAQVLIVQKSCLPTDH